MTVLSETSCPHIQEEMWIEIIQKMELLYADLARMQTEAERKNEELIRTKAFADNVIRSLVNVLVVSDRHSAVTTANDACRQLLGYAEDELLGRPLGTIVPGLAGGFLDGGSEIWDRCRTSGSVMGIETVLKTKLGEEIPVSLNVSVMCDGTGDIIGMVLVATDLREIQRLLLDARAAADAERAHAAEMAKAYRNLKALQTRLIQAEKMSSLGRMAASVAHEINNPLGAVQVFSHLLLENTPADFDGRRYLTKIVRETNRCRDIVRSLLDFSRPARESCRPADLNAIVHATLDLLAGHAVLMNVEIVLDLSPATLDIVCDSSQIQQAFTNIVINAAEAIHDTGKIEIRSWKEAPPNSMVAVSFADTGCGIPPENLEHIFDPFFTTKEEGHSTGLGLAVVYGIVERHGGTMNVDSSPGRGTTFTLRLPERETEEGSP